MSYFIPMISTASAIITRNMSVNISSPRQMSISYNHFMKLENFLTNLQVHPKQNAFAFQTKRKYVLSKTQGHFILNVRAF